METNPTGTAPLTTAGEGNGAGSQESQQQLIARLQSENEQLQRERDEAKDMALRANRAAEAGRKFEKFDEFQTSVTSELASLKGAVAKIPTLEEENKALREIIAGKAAATANIPSAPISTQPPIPEDVRQQKINGIFGLPPTKS